MTWERILDGGDDRGELIGDAYRPIRRLAAGETPIVGELAAAGDDLVILADVRALAGWHGWIHGGSQHVCGVRDVARRTGGHDAVLPRCVRPLEAALRAADPPPSGGEAVTLAVSMMRGMRELHDTGGIVTGSWWLTGDARPMFVASLGAEGEGCEPASARILEDVSSRVEDRVVRRLLDEIVVLMADGLGDRVEELEERLFEACAPRPLERLLSQPDGEGHPAPAAPPARPHRTRRELRASRGGPERLPRVARDGRRASRRSVAATRSGIDVREVIDAALAGRIAQSLSDALAVLRRRARALAGRRGTPLLVGGVAAAVVVAGGLMWPSDDGPAAAGGAAEGAEAKPDEAGTDEPRGESGDDHPVGGAEEEAGGDASPSPGSHGDEAPPPPTDEEPLTAAERLLRELASCAPTGAGCEVAPGADIALPVPAVLLLPEGERRLILRDDFGDLAVLRVEAADGSAPAQSLVIERSAADGRWSVRDVYEHVTAPGTTEGDG